MIYTYGNNGHYQTGFYGFDSYSTTFVVVPPDLTPPRARHPIGVNQPPNGGTDYPLVRPSPDIENLLGDFYLSYPDDTCSYAYPFRIQWMYGFGDKTVTPPAGYPIPTHDYDILIKDDNDVTVFDSCLCGIGDDSDNLVPYTTSVWYDRLVIIEWTDASKDTVCRCTKFIGWDSYSTDYQDYDDYIVPASIDPDNTPGGILSPRTYNKLPLRLRSLRVSSVYGDLGTVLQGDIILHSKYNIELQDNPSDLSLGDLNLDDFGITLADPLIEGTRLTNRISIDSEPGLGSGVYPSCDPDTTTAPLRRLNSAKGDDQQNIILDPGKDCIRLQRPVELTNDCPREFEFDGTAVGYSDTVAPYTNRLMNDCTACCDCDYFARTYQGLKRQWFSYQKISTDGLEARDQFNANIIRWNYQKECREGNPFVFDFHVVLDCHVDIRITFGNPSACCLVGVHMRVTFEYYNGTQWVSDSREDGIITNAEIQTSENDEGPESYDVVGEFPVIDIATDYVQPSSPFQFGCKVSIPECSEGDKLRVSAHVWWENELTPENATCNYPTLARPSTDLPQEILDIWTLVSMPIPPYPIHYGKISNIKELNNASPYPDHIHIR